MDRSSIFVGGLGLIMTFGLVGAGPGTFPAVPQRPSLPVPASATVVVAPAQSQPKEGGVKSFLAGWVSSIKTAVGNFWDHCPRVAKDSIELTGLAAVDVAMQFYGEASNNTVLPVLTAYAIGQVGSEILDRHKYYLKTLGYGAVVGLVELIKLWSGKELATLSTSAIMALVHTTFDEYAKMTGRKNTFTEDFRDLPARLQTMVIDRLKKLGKQVQAVMRGAHAMPMDGVSMATAGMRTADVVADMV